MHQWGGRPRVPDAPLILGTRAHRRDRLVSFWPDHMRFERIGHYDVTALIGEGGMGQVYQATDTKLDRDVALNVVPQAFT